MIAAGLRQTPAGTHLSLFGVGSYLFRRHAQTV
jgi:hypothetical protein